MSKSILQPDWKNTGLTLYRFEQIKSYLAGKKVLDVGSAVGYRKNNWMFGLIKQNALSVIGIDIDENAVKEIQAKGFDVRLGDACNFDLNEKFEIVHAGELIEHLDDFHGFLQSVKRHIQPGGSLVMTTPNAMRIGNFIYSMFGGLEVNREHTCWFCDKTMKTLLERNGYSVEEIAYVKHRSKGVLRKLASSVIRGLLPERVIWNTLLVVAKPR